MSSVIVLRPWEIDGFEEIILFANPNPIYSEGSFLLATMYNNYMTHQEMRNSKSEEHWFAAVRQTVQSCVKVVSGLVQRGRLAFVVRSSAIFSVAPSLYATIDVTIPADHQRSPITNLSLPLYDR